MACCPQFPSSSIPPEKRARAISDKMTRATLAAVAEGKELRGSFPSQRDATFSQGRKETLYVLALLTSGLSVYLTPDPVLERGKPKSPTEIA